MKWNPILLGELESQGDINLQTGPFGTQLKASDYTEHGTPVINVRNIGFGNLREEKLEYVPENVVERLEKHLLQEGDIVFGRKGAVDRHLLVKEGQSSWMQGSDCIRLRVQSKKITSNFLSYWFLLGSHKNWMLTQCSNKATMASLNQDVIKRIPVSLPDIDVQNKIADILSRYDEAIANNRRRIELLERSSRLLYREWFVHLRYPGHEHGAIGSDGIPEGWKKKKIENVCETVGGGTPSTKNPDYWDGDITWVVPTDITRNNCLALLNSERKITEKGLKESSAKMLPPETILMTSRASVGFFALVDREVCTNQGFISIVPYQTRLQMYLLHNLMYRVEEIRSHAGGTTYAEISKTRFRNLDIVIPSKLLLEQFQEQAHKIFQQVQLLQKQNQKLQAARDLLLPRLMNGEINV